MSMVLVVSFMLSYNFMLYFCNLYDCDFIGYFVLILKQFLLFTTSSEVQTVLSYSWKTLTDTVVWFCNNIWYILS